MPENHENGILINSIVKLEECDRDKLWPELIRLLVIHSDERHDLEIESLKDYSYMNELFRRVGALTPQSYSYSLSYREKVDLLLFLVDNIHDLDSFRQFLNRRLEDKSQLFK